MVSRYKLVVKTSDNTRVAKGVEDKTIVTREGFINKGIA